MAMKLKFSVLILSAVISIYAIVGGLLPQYGVVASNDPYSQMTIFHEVLNRIVNDYVDEPDLDKVRLGALRGLAEGLDPYSAYLTPDQAARYSPTPPAAPAESGASLSKVAGYVYIISVLKGSAGDLGGFRAGDVIEYLSGQATRDLSLYEAMNALRGEPGKQVEARLFRGGRSQTVTFKLDRLKPAALEAKIQERGIGYLHPTVVSQSSLTEIRTQLKSLLDQGIQKLILDLRNTSGGTMKDGVTLANFFIGSGTLAKTIGREGKELETFIASGPEQVFRGQLAVLTERSTSGAAEVVAAAVLENKRGEVIGERTFGSGGEQQMFKLRDGGALLITTVKYASPSGRPFMGSTAATSGVTPTVEIKRPSGQDPLSPEELEEDGVPQPDDREESAPAPPTEDKQLKKAIEILREAKMAAAA
ncbi:MAG: hypothetical protein HY650_10415 [Acidobacteria bacterium]|nr:hypothetical protein [Acidobacteriota bacterium]